MNNFSNNVSWEKILDKYDIIEKINATGHFIITANQIKEFREPRLMVKFDAREAMPQCFIRNELSILPITRGSYVIGKFNLYQDFPEQKNDTKPTPFSIPSYLETINVEDIHSEAGAINIALISQLFDDFLEEYNMTQTVSGRMGSGKFDFLVHNGAHSHPVFVQNSQIEIDAGVENENTFAIVEAKNVINSNFLVRQLYYPYRVWKNKISKPIRTIFMIYSNGLFRLLEYKFEQENLYNSLVLTKEQYYSAENTDISLEDIIETFKSTEIKQSHAKIPFVQADSFEKLISLVENIKNNPLTTEEIAELFSFDERQSDYYYNAAAYLGLMEKRREDNNVRVYLTQLGENVLKLKYKERQLKLIKLILSNKIFNEIFSITIKQGEIPDREYIKQRMRELRVCNEPQIHRRSGSVISWIKWILSRQTY